jgi:hypothetical protein
MAGTRPEEVTVTRRAQRRPSCPWPDGAFVLDLMQTRREESRLRLEPVDGRT